MTIVLFGNPDQMCGITGILFNEPSRPVPADRLRRMCRLMAHRGPDEEAIFVEGNLGLGFRRLSIIDVSGGHQPIASESGRCHLVCNGEIYNFLALRTRLEARGHRFRTGSDVEVILHLYEDFGDACVEHLRGMYAFALWDAGRRRLLLGRDRLGKKPLYYRIDPEGIVFGSEIRLLRVGETGPPSLDDGALADFLTLQYVPAPDTIYRDIKKLPAGHILAYEQGGLNDLRRYWALHYEPKTEQRFGSAVLELQSLLREATAIRLTSEVPLGAFLSGGIDSALITALMARVSDRPVKTYCMGFESDLFDESGLAARTAALLGTEHKTIRVVPDFPGILPELVWHFGEPFADPAALPLYCLCQAARPEITVALTGDGGDEAFAGYARYALNRIARLAGHLPKSLTQGLLGNLLRLLPDIGLDRSLVTTAKRFVAALDLPPRVQNLQRSFFLQEADKARILTPEFRAHLSRNTLDRALAWYDRVHAKDPLDQTLAHDVGHYLADGLLTKGDISSMSHSLELRSPFLDHQVMEFAAALPPRWKLRGLRNGKYILKTVAQRLLPREVLARRKRGFSPPVSEWFRADRQAWVRELLLDSRTLGRGYFDPRELTRMLDDHLAGRDDHGKRLWALVNLELWQRVYMDDSHWQRHREAA